MKQIGWSSSDSSADVVRHTIHNDSNTSSEEIFIHPSTAVCLATQHTDGMLSKP